MKTSGGNPKLMAKALVYRARAYRASEHRLADEAMRLARADLEEAHRLEPKDRIIGACGRPSLWS